ncbi:VOC family protein [Mucilaginibacter rigui]|uniref:VOC family protein n=1 Tax=Mucilaginibacter rigui TaxID=534635 RepID=A0ABR7X8L2_9SPHI|nr:VOC family protein [Mucilaginibacter rigui]MBD1386928.1 VOC family protein [Mucilaginibacter rigui]
MEIKVKLDTIILYVQNVDRLKSFYTNVFNLKIVEEYESIWTLLDVGNSMIGLHKIGDKYLNASEGSFKFNNNTKIVFEINEDINEVRRDFISQNVVMREIKTFDNYDYWLCDGEDPEGNVFQLKQKKQ